MKPSIALSCLLAIVALVACPAAAGQAADANSPARKVTLTLNIADSEAAREFCETVKLSIIAGKHRLALVPVQVGANSITIEAPATARRIYVGPGSWPDMSDDEFEEIGRYDREWAPGDYFVLRDGVDHYELSLSLAFRSGVASRRLERLRQEASPGVQIVRLAEGPTRRITLRVNVSAPEDSDYWDYVWLRVAGAGLDVRVDVDPGEQQFSLEVPIDAGYLYIQPGTPAQVMGEASPGRDYSLKLFSVGRRFRSSERSIALRDDATVYDVDFALEPMVALTGRVRWWDGGGTSGIIEGERAGSPPFGGGWRSQFELVAPKGEPNRLYVVVSRVNPLRPADEGWTVTIRFPYELRAEQTADSGDIGDIFAPKLGEPTATLTYTVTSRQVGVGPGRQPASLGRLVLVSADGVVWESHTREDVRRARYTLDEPDLPAGIFHHEGEVFAPPGSYYTVPLFASTPETTHPMYDAVRAGDPMVLSRLKKVTLREGQTAEVALDEHDVERLIEAQSAILDRVYGRREVPLRGELRSLAPDPG